MAAPPVYSSAILFFFIFPLTFALHINCGGNSLDGGAIVADSFAKFGGRDHGRYYNINATRPHVATVYDTHAWGRGSLPVQYQVDVPGKNNLTGADLKYQVVLQFAETWMGTAGPGKRRLNVYVNSDAVAQNLDIWSAAGGRMFAPYDIVVDDVVPDAMTIYIRIVSIEQNAIISGIQITPIRPPGSTATPVPVPIPSHLIPRMTLSPPSESPTPPHSVSASASPAPTTGKPPSLSVEFSRVDDYPLRVFEAQGTVLGSGSDKYLTVFGGFYEFPGVTSRVYQRRWGNESAPWERLPDMPDPAVTHMAQVVIDGDTFCGAGGFIGADPGRSGNQTWCYNRTTKSWKRLADLPGDRAGGGLVRIGERLLFSGGVDRERDSHAIHVDYGTTWTLDYKTPGAQWVDTNQSMPNPRNHQAAVDTCGRILFVGGQHQGDEHTGNQATVSEWLVDEGKWSDVNPPANLPFPVGHVSASVMAYKCGIIVVGGIRNGRSLVNTVLYWDSKTNTWSDIGKYPHVVATPVCGIDDDTIMCATAGSHWLSNRVYFGNIVAK